MRALVKAKPEPGLWMQDVPLPEPGDGDVLIRVHKTSICGTDLHIRSWDAWAQATVPVPMVVGHEFTGEITAVGTGVQGLEVGQRVAGEGHVTCGHCRNCKGGRREFCHHHTGVGVTRPGAFADFVVIPALNGWEVDPRIPPEAASILEPFGNAVHTAFSGGGAEEIATAAVVVLGCGPIGLFALGVARAAGARMVIAVEPNDFRLDLAKQMGADVLVDPSADDPVDAVRRATDGHGAEVVLEMSGVPKVIDQGTRMLARGGRMSLLGLPSEPVSLDLTDQVIFKEARLFGVTGRELFRTWQQTTTLLASGMVDVTPVITHRFRLEQFEEAFAAMASGRSGKVIMIP
jgi:threonine 3-dehydrogenase